MILRRCLPLFAAAALTLHAERLEFVWPTPNPAFAEGRPASAFLQPTQSGDPESGGFGCVRSNGYQFHEGIDLKPLRHDARGEPTDDVYAAMDGVVRYINNRVGESSYGRYLVLEHPDASPAVYTLYAHLARIAPGISPGVRVTHGQTIATMGHTAGGYAIPRDRAHLHFEVGLMMTRDFQSWYIWKKFGSPNTHGLWNGMNLMGVDPLDVLQQWRDRKTDTFADYFAHLAPVVRLRIATRSVPDFVQRYPSLLAKPMPFGLVAGWEISCDWTGLPFRWEPLEPTQTLGMRPNEVVILAADEAQLRRQHCKHLLDTHRGHRVPGKDLEEVLQQVFGLR
jgi:peptidoglycan LD-endopeptidase LytH